MHSNRINAAIVGLGLLAAACGSATSTSSSAPGTQVAQETAAPPDQTLPGTEAFGLTEEQFADVVERTEASIASCMATAGFEYVPIDVPTVAAVGEWLRTEPGVSRLDYKTEWGFAASTRFDDPAVDRSRGEHNQRIFADLSDADQTAYERTLYGGDPDATFAITLDDEDFEGTGGCTRSAVEEVFPPEMLETTFVNPKDILISDDPRVIAAEEAWVGCMLDAGYDYGDQDDIIAEYEERLDDLLDGADPEGLPDSQAAALADLQAEEIRVALVDYECQIAHVDDVIREVEIEVFGFVVSVQ
ncbi:MAG: hypothetical protein ACI91O_000567 [Candidatus Poriferisodalaceae bacterium]|jgi:hypothetical protein